MRGSCGCHKAEPGPDKSRTPTGTRAGQQNERLQARWGPARSAGARRLVLMGPALERASGPPLGMRLTARPVMGTTCRACLLGGCGQGCGQQCEPRRPGWCRPRPAVQGAWDPSAERRRSVARAVPARGVTAGACGKPGLRQRPARAAHPALGPHISLSASCWQPRLGPQGAHTGVTPWGAGPSPPGLSHWVVTPRRLWALKGPAWRPRVTVAKGWGPRWSPPSRRGPPALEPVAAPRPESPRRHRARAAATWRAPGRLSSSCP